MKLQTNDPIADLLTRIRNSLMVGKPEVSVAHSKLKEQLLKLLKQRGFISSYTTVVDGFKELHIILFEEGTNSPITALERVSKPGRRVYVKSGEIPHVMGGVGLAVVSTSSGLMDGQVARKQGKGGELICKVW